MYKENFPNRKQLHPYERSLVELTLGDGNYEEVSIMYFSFYLCTFHGTSICFPLFNSVKLVKFHIISINMSYWTFLTKRVSWKECYDKVVLCISFFTITIAFVKHSVCWTVGFAFENLELEVLCFVCWYVPTYYK